QDFHPLAKIAKDCASTAVLLSVILAILVWGVILFQWWQSL
ncbi:MAG: diacylglycerol kinase, partial [Helicobacter sp.]|nr:diacylglycerol kinase [Helicobacter sp.]